MKPELISFKVCPFVQRSAITLNEKGIEYTMTYIDLQSPPAWFSEISPLGKVPVLKVGDTVLFESAVIMEYLDEVNPPGLHPVDPLQKAQNRAWIEFASTLLMSQFNMVVARDEAAFNTAKEELHAKLTTLEMQITGPFFNGTGFALVDASFAPLFMRIDMLEQWHEMGLLADLPRCTTWSQALLERPSVKNSVVDEFPQLCRTHVIASGSFIAQYLSG